MRQVCNFRRCSAAWAILLLLAPLAAHAESPAVTAGQAAAAAQRSNVAIDAARVDSRVDALPNVPPWAADAIFYQIFPERFRNGDRTNDPTHDSLEFPDRIPKSWQPSPWTGDWYARAAWEEEAGDNFFENGVFNRRYGGDLQGVLDKLPYLDELGVNAIYFNPVFYGRSLHKYDGASMHHIDPYFGPDPRGDLKLIASETSDPASWHWTAADKIFLQLLTEAHARKIRVIIDGVFNHTGRDFFAFADLRKNQERSPYREWYVVGRFDDPATPGNEFQYKGWWNNDTLPEFSNNTAGDDLHPGPRQYVMDVTRRWMDPDGDGDPRDGIDGWRLDVAEEVPLPFWKQWNAYVRSINPGAYTVAEVWNDALEFLVGGGFSATMNYHAFAFPVKGYLVDGRMTAHDFARELEIRRQKYPAPMQFALQNLIDSHDTDRLASMIVNRPRRDPYLQADRFDYDVSPKVSPRHSHAYDVRKPNAEDRGLQRMVVLLQMTYLGAPMVYYGDEAGMWGGDDPCDRMPMVWDDLQPYEPQASDPSRRPRQPDEVAVDQELLAFYKRAIALRREGGVFRHGAYAAVETNDDAQFFAFRRTLGDATALVAFNRGEKEFRWQPPKLRPAAKLEVLLSTVRNIESGPLPTGAQDVLILPPHSAVVIAER